MVSYIDNNLLSDETVVRRADIHWFIYVQGLALLLLGALAPALSLDPIGFICAIIGASLLVNAVLQRLATELALTNKRLIAKHGLIVRKTVELNLSKVESLSVDQSIMGRIFDFGTVTVNGTGGVHTPFRFIDHPLEFRRAVNEQVEAAQKGQN